MNNPVRDRIKVFLLWKRENGIKYSVKDFAQDLRINFQYLRAVAYGSYIVRSEPAVSNFIKAIDEIQCRLDSGR